MLTYSINYTKKLQEIFQLKKAIVMSFLTKFVLIMN